MARKEENGMSIQSFSDGWLTDNLEWDNGAEWIDAPFLPGVPVRIQEKKVIQWDDRPRWGFNVWIGKDAPAHTSVLVVEGERQKMYCSDHDGDCDCKRVVGHFLYG